MIQLLRVIQERLISLNERYLFARYKQPSSVECYLCMHSSDAIIKSLINRLAVRHLRKEVSIGTIRDNTK